MGWKPLETVGYKGSLNSFKFNVEMVDFGSDPLDHVWSFLAIESRVPTTKGDDFHTWSDEFRANNGSTSTKKNLRDI